MPQVTSDSIPTRPSLLRRVKDWQDQASWQEFHDIYRGIIRGFALKSGLTEADADDVVQETLVEVAQKMPGFNYDPARRGYFRAWLLQLTRWRVRDHFRKHARQRRMHSPNKEATDQTDAIERVPDPAVLDCDAAWEQEWESKLLEAAREEVRRRADPQKFQIFDLCVHKEWPPGKVAEAFGVSVGQVYLVRHRLSKMIEAAAKRLNRRMS